MNINMQLLSRSRFSLLDPKLLEPIMVATRHDGLSIERALSCVNKVLHLGVRHKSTPPIVTVNAADSLTAWDDFFIKINY